MKSILALMLSLLSLATSAQEAAYYVSPKGNDSAEGSSKKPWKTPDGALANVRKIMQEDPSRAVTLYFAEGEYPISQTLTFDSVAIGKALTLKPLHEGDEVIFSGDVAVKKWQKVKDESVLSRLSDEVHGRIWQTDLIALGIEDLCTVAEREIRMDFYFDGERLQIARWPNEGFTLSGKSLGATPLPPTWLTKGGSKEGVFEYVDERIDRWAAERDIVLNGYWYWDWSEQFQTIASMDIEKRVITLNEPYHHYGYRNNFRYYAMNLLCELDSVGEYYVDREAGMLYWYAPDEFNPKKSATTLSVFPGEYMLSFKNCSNVTMEGLTFRGGRGNAIRMEGGADNTLARCTIRQFGCDAMHLTDSPNFRMDGCLMEQLGCSGLIASGGNRKTLAPAGYVFEHTTVRHFSLFKHTYEPAIRFSGCGMQIRHNHFQHSTSSAMRIDGTDVWIEYNRFFDLVKESDDQGGMDMWFNPGLRGVVIRFNHWKNITGGTHNGAAGVRFDDMISGQLVYGNIFEHCGSVIFGGVQIHGGKDNTVENNLFYDCNAAVSFTPWGPDRWSAFVDRPEVQTMLKENIDPILYRKRYPEMREDIKSHADRNFVRNNLAVRCPQLFLRENGSNVLENNTLLENESQPLEHYLQPAFLRKYGLNEIPFKEIGPQKRP